MLEKSIIQILTTIFAGYTEIEAVYLFGSAASDKETPYHDIDIGILYSDASIKGKEIDLYADMVRHGIENADIVFFNTADLVLQFEIIRPNKPIYQRKDFNHGNLFSLTMRKYLDFQPYLKKQRKLIKTRILNG